MNIVSLDAADFGIVELKTTNQCDPTPHCKKHGAMNKITADGIWRCISVTGYTLVKNGNSVGKQHRESICQAGCKQID